MLKNVKEMIKLENPVFFVFEDFDEQSFVQKYDLEIDFTKWDKKQSSLFHKTSYDGENIMFYSLGKREEYTDRKFRRSLPKIVNKALEYKIESLQFILDPGLVKDKIKTTFEFAETLELLQYDFIKYKKEKKVKKYPDIDLHIPGNNFETLEAMKESEILSKAVNFGRDLVNEPANVIYPATLALEAEKAGKDYGFEVEIKSKNEITKLGMEAFLSVAQGSSKEPILIIMRYKGNPSKPEQIFGLVGKGLTYDSGGYSIKSTAGMLNMKADMGGAAAVIGTICALAKNKINCNVTAVIAACENLISGKAYKPGDIIGSMAGKTIEVGNTDAEGRLTLIDAVYYTVKKEKVTHIIDTATLTGAVLVSLGTERSGVLTNNDKIYENLSKVSELSDEKFWRLPHDEEYLKLLKSEIADINNVGGKNAGTVTAGLFIKEFLPENIPWMHIDIAGTAWTQNKSGYLSKGATGAPIRSLYHLIKRFYSYSEQPDNKEK